MDLVSLVILGVLWLALSHAPVARSKAVLDDRLVSRAAGLDLPFFRDLLDSIDDLATFGSATQTAGVVLASKPAIPDSNKDLGDFRNLRVVRLILETGAPTSDATAGNRTYTAAEILGGIIVRDCAGGSRSDVLPTAALLVAAVPGAKVGDIIEVMVVNGSDAAEVITLGAGAGGGFDTNQTAASRVIPQNATKSLRIRLTNVTASSEAYVAYL